MAVRPTGPAAGLDRPADGAVPSGGRGSDDTARRLVDAAAAVFAEKGYDGAGVAEIARRAGLTTGAIYSRYSGKAELLAAAVQASVPAQIEQLFAETRQSGRVDELLRVVGHQLVTCEPAPHHGLLLEAVVAARRDPEVAAVVHEALQARRDRWRATIEAGKARGGLTDEVDTDALVHFAQAVGLGFLVYEAIGIDNPDPEPWQSLIAHLVDSLTPSASAGPSPAGTPPPDRSSHGQ